MRDNPLLRRLREGLPSVASARSRCSMISCESPIAVPSDSTTYGILPFGALPICIAAALYGISAIRR